MAIQNNNTLTNLTAVAVGNVVLYPVILVNLLLLNLLGNKRAQFK
jgi:hypothetical protein